VDIPDAQPGNTGSSAEKRLLTWHPGWLGVVMGTGGAAFASLFDPLPSTKVDEVIGAALAAISVVLLPVLGVPYLLRLHRHRHALLADLSHPGVGALFGTLPASLLITSIALAQLATIGWLPSGTVWICVALFVVGVLGALLVGVEFFSRVVRLEQVPVAAMTGAWFIPVVVLVLVPSMMIRLANLHPSWATPAAVFFAAATWGAGLLVFLLLAPMVGWRLITAPGPIGAQASTWWIWLAPPGAGGLGLLAIARLAAQVFDGPAGAALPTAGLLAASMFWGFGVWWSLLAGRVLWTTAHSDGGLPFGIGSWGFTFPTAAMTALTIELGRSFHAPLLQGIGALLWVALLIMWVRLAWLTVAGVISGTVFDR
jgi:C4-dicarboxylate transporter/malic acid transport protein